MKRLGVIDSGIGGLTIVKDLAKNDLACEIFYISDSLNVPWGNKSQSFMFERISKMTEILISNKVDSILIACNTATAETINKLRETFAMNFIGVEPYINYINHDSEKENHKYLLILTQATFHSERFQKLLHKLDPLNNISIYPQKNLAMLIESLKTKSFDDIKDQVEAELSNIDPRLFTHIILGCTHYPIISDYFLKNMNLKIIDSTPRISDRVIKSLGLQKSEFPFKEIFYSENAEETFILKPLKDFHFLYLSDI